jgi:DNA (cytosine-5)-methyltransferase 1
MKYFSMFAGINGFEKGIEDATKSIKSNKQHQKYSTPRECGDSLSSKIIQPNKSSLWWNNFDWKCIGRSEIDKYADSIARYHYPSAKNYGDATRIIPEELPDFDCIVGGFPCQSFSIAGKREAFSDIRGTLFFEICRIARVKRPAYLWLENVKGLFSAPYTETIEEWSETDFDENGEPTESAKRKHKQIPGTKGWVFLTILNTLWELGYDCQWQLLNSKYHGVPQNRERVFIIANLRGKRRPKIFPIGENTEVDYGEEGLISNTIKVEYANGYRTGIYIAQSKLTPQKIRILTPKECERLQGFPDDWTKYGLDENKKVVEISDSQRYKCLGNAVTTNVIRDIVLKWENS